MACRKIQKCAARLAASVLGLSISVSAYASQPPSLDVGFVLVSGWQAATHPDYAHRFPTPEAIKDWQVETARVIAGGDLGPSHNARTLTLDYIYLQKLNRDPALLEMSLKLEANRLGIDYEDYFFHYAEDTWHTPNKPLDPAKPNALYGTPYIAGHTISSDHAGNAFPRNRDADVQAFARWQDGGALYVYNFEPFDELRLTLQREEGGKTGELTVEVPAEISSTGQVLVWEKVAIQDTTNTLTQSGALKFTPPKWWAPATTHDGSGRSFGGGAYFANRLLRHGGRLYTMRLSWRPADMDPLSKGPLIKRVLLRPIIEQTEKGLLVRGWDAHNDGDGSGYVDDDEFSALKNPKATARFRHEARLSPLDSQFAGGEGWAYANLTNPTLQQALARYYRAFWHGKGMAGGYNDEFWKRPGPHALGSRIGGRLIEYPNTDIEEDKFIQAYIDGFRETFETISGTEPRYHLSANTSHYTLTKHDRDFRFVTSLKSLLREDYTRVSHGLAGWTGLLMTADLGIMAAHGAGNLLQGTVRDGRAINFGHTKENWRKDHEALAAQAFLLHLPGSTAFTFWNSGYWYGNGLTSEKDYYIAGVPRVVAFYPEPFINVDLGAPTNLVPDGKKPAPLFMRRGNNFIKVGDTTSTILAIPMDETRRKMKAKPTAMFIAHEQGQYDKRKNIRHDMVLGRAYEKGLVYYRTNFYGRDRTFFDTEPVTIPLTVPMRRIDLDGNPGEPVSEISLGGYEGAILIYAE